MADEQDDQPTDGRAGRAVAKRGVPRISLEVAEGYAKHLWDVARGGSTSEGVLAKQIGGETAKASGGTWRTKVASLNYWGLIEQMPGSQLKLSEIGLRIVRLSEPEVVAAARRDALLQVKAYENILQAADGHELPATAGIAGKFHYDFEMSESDASRAADAFVSSVERAGISGTDGIVRLSGAHRAAESDGDTPDVDETGRTDAALEPDIHPAVPEGEEPEADLDADADADVAGGGRGDGPKRQPREELAPEPPVYRREIAVPTADPGVSLRVKIDMSDWAADDVVKVLSALGFPGPRG